MRSEIYFDKLIEKKGLKNDLGLRFVFGVFCVFAGIACLAKAFWLALSLVVS